jgi:hypothetical protein
MLPNQEAGVISQHVITKGSGGVEIDTTVELLRRYVFIERGLMRALAGWFIAHPDYEAKYAIAHHLWHHAEHVNWLRERLVELRGGRIEASVEPGLGRVIDAIVDAPDAASFVAGAYRVLLRQLNEAYQDHRRACDPAANAYEHRLLGRLLLDADEHLTWADKQPAGSPEWSTYIADLLKEAGGVSGLASRSTNATAVATKRFQRPTTLIFDQRIGRGGLSSYDARKDADKLTATREDFKVFFNEFYAAALLASVLYDADQASLPWEFFYDFAHHFWDEVRHSQFGYLRLKELGIEPNAVNPVLFENSQGMPVLHRIAYLTLGLEVYFMPRKRPRVKAYIERNDPRSQFFADQDWSDEANHVRYGKKWVGFLLEDDMRTEEDVLAEVRKHLEAVTGKEQAAFAAPF